MNKLKTERERERKERNAWISWFVSQEKREKNDWNKTSTCPQKAETKIIKLSETPKWYFICLIILKWLDIKLKPDDESISKHIFNNSLVCFGATTNRLVPKFKRYAFSIQVKRFSVYFRFFIYFDGMWNDIWCMCE